MSEDHGNSKPAALNGELGIFSLLNSLWKSL